MATTNQIIDVILQLRRDNDYNYKKVENSFVPLKGEVCLVDTVRNGLRAKVGDGITSFKNLRFIDEDMALNIIIKGYLSNNQFYSDAKLTKVIEASVNKIYIDVANSVVYIYDGSQYKPITQSMATATESTAGIMKLYEETGSNTDGTMTQKAITDELNDKVEISTDAEDELLTFYLGGN